MDNPYDLLVESPPLGETAPSTRNLYGDILDTEEGQRKAALQQSISVAVKTPPEAAAKVRQLADASGMPTDVVARNTEAVAAQERARALYEASKADPVLRRQLLDPEFAKLAQDDSANISAVGKVVRFPWKMTQSIASGLPSIASGVYGAMAAPFEVASQYVGKPLAGKLLPEDIFGKVGEGLRALSTRQKNYATAVADVDPNAGLFERSVASGFQSLGSNLPMLITALYTDNPQMALTAMAGMAGGQSYTKGREAGLTPTRAAIYGVQDAFAEYVTELLPTTRLLGSLKAGDPFVKTFMKNQVQEQLGEQAATVMQDFNEWANLHPADPFSKYLQERPSAALQTAIATAIGSGGQVTLMKAAQMNAERTGALAAATHDAGGLHQLMALANESLLRERSPTTFANFVNAAAAEGPVPAVFIDAQAFAQAAQEAGLDVTKSMPETAAALQDAIDTKSDVRIPIGEFAAVIPGTTLEQSLIPQLRTSEDGPTHQEATDKQWVEDTQAATEKILAQHVFDTAHKASQAVVEKDLLAQLTTANRFTGDVNRAYAGFMGAFYGTQAARLGLTPQEMYAKYPLRISAQGTGMSTFDQATPAESLARYYRSMTWASEQEAREHITRRLVEENDRYGGMFNPTDPAIVNDLRFTRAKGGRVKVVVKQSREELANPIGTVEPEYEHPEVDWSARDLADEGTADDVMKVYGRGKGRVYQAWIDINKIPLPKGEDIKDGYLDEHSGAREELGHRGAPPPLKVRIGPKGKIELMDGNHRLAYWREQGYGSVPAYVIDERAAPADDTLNQPAYHGSPHDFDKFSTDKIGTGEGAQAYGWGLYFAENPAVAEGYRRDLTTQSLLTVRDSKGNILQQGDAVDDVTLEAIKWLESGKKAAGQFPHNTAYYAKQSYAASSNPNPAVAAKIDELKDAKIGYEKPKGALYKVDIPDEHVAKMLLWDKPLSQQPENVRKALAEFGDSREDVAKFDDALLAALESDGPDPGKMPRNPTGEELYHQLAAQPHMLPGFKVGMDSREAASKYLASLGIPGIKYLDQQSRGKDEKQTHNLVVFDDSIVKLTHKDGTPVTAQERADYLQPAGWDETDGSGFVHTPPSTAPGSNTRGMISLTGDIKSTPPLITLLHAADLSSFLHESGHFYLEVLADMAAQPSAPPEIVDDFNKTLKWFGIKADEGRTPAEVWQSMTLEEKRPHHEKWARGFESYLFEGRAPSSELTSLFARFRAWMINVYKQLQALNVTLTDEVRGVMDRLVATNEEIIQAEAARNYAPLFESKPDGMSDADWISYQQEGAAATQDAVDELQTRSVRDMQYAANARGKALKALQKSAAHKRAIVRAEVTQEVKDEPIYRAREFFLNGIESPETVTHLLPATKLDAAAIAELYPESMLNRPNIAALDGMTAKDGIEPGMAAEMFGFGSADELIHKLIDAEPMQSKIEGITDQRMLERHGDLADPAAINKAASIAVHNDVRARFVATELNALTKAVGQKKLLNKAAKDFAETLIARKKLKDIKPNTYEAAETRAARNAERALKSNDLITAATEKRNQLVNLYATKAAYKAQDEIERDVAYLKRVGESTRIDRDYVEQIQGILERFDLRAKSTRVADIKQKTLAEWVKQQEDLGFDPVIAADLIESTMAQHYQTLTLEELRGIVDTVKNIEHLGRLKKKLLTLKDKREFDAVVADTAESIIDNAKRTVTTKLEHNTWADKMKSGTAEFFAMHRKFASFLREMDAFKDNGTMWKLFGRPMNEAGNTEAVLREKATVELQKLLAPIFKGGKMHTKTFIPEINASLSREGRIMVALNTGNAGNLQRLMDGDHWTMPQVQAVLDTLTKEEMDFVQSIWDFVGSYRDQIGEQQKRLTGISPEWVEPRDVITKHGVYKGGYLPAKYDTTRSTRALSNEESAGIMDQWRAKRGRASVRESFVKARADAVVDRPLRKDFGVITQHITEVSHRLAWKEFLIDAQRLLRAGPIDHAIREHYGHETLQAMRNAIEDIAAGEVGAQNAFERGVNYLRTGATIAGLGWRVTTSLLQPIGLTQSMVRIGPKYVGRGLREWLGTPSHMNEVAENIYAKSSMMRLRGKTMQREISEIQNQVRGKSSAIEASYFYMIQKMQLVADIPTWLGQYNKAVEKGADEAGAVAQADQAVLDAQGGGQIKDLAAIQRGGPLLKLFTNFYSFFNTTYNLTQEAVGRTNFKDPIAVGRLAVDMLLLYSVPAVLGTLMKAALHSGDDDASKKLVRQLIADQLTYLFGTMVGLREVAGGLQTAAGLPGDYQGPASVRVFAELAKFGKQAGQGEVDEALLKAANNVGGILFHYPAGQINATADGLVTMARGKTDNPGALLVGSNKR